MIACEFGATGSISQDCMGSKNKIAYSNQTLTNRRFLLE